MSDSHPPFATGTVPDSSRAASDEPSATANPTRISSLLPGVVIVGVVSMLGVAVLWLVFGSLPVAVRYLRGERLILEPARLRAERLSTSTPVLLTTTIRNFTGRPVRLLGSSVRCTCVVTQKLPAMIPPGGTFRLSLRVQASAEKPTVDEPIVIFTDHREHPRLGVRVTGASRGES